MKLKFFVLLVLAAPLNILASRYDQNYDNDYYSCQSSCARWAVTVKGGIAPIVWTGRDNFVAEPTNPECSFCTTGGSTKIGKFKDFFKLPWTVGLEFDYLYSECLVLYLDFQYRQAKARHKAFRFVLDCDNLTIPLLFSFNKYRSESLYFGFDYYFWQNCGCAPVSLFAGLKVGFTHYSHLQSHLIQSDFDINQSIRLHGKTVISGGGRVGLDYAYNDCVSLLLTAEFLAQRGHRFNNSLISIAPVVSNFTIGIVGTELVFPITLGIRYIF